MQSTELLVIGAGPFGLSVAAHAKHCGMSVTVVGEPMGFWKHNMPAGMLLRSGLDWQLDAGEVHTLVSFIEEKRLPLRAAEPIPVEIFRDYAEWFRQCKKIDVQSLRLSGCFESTIISRPGPDLHAFEDKVNPVERRSR